MATKIKKLEEILSISGEAAKVMSYADYFARKPLFSSLQIKNIGEEGVNDLVLTVENTGGMLLSCEKTLEEIPYESSVEIELGDILSPVYFSNLEETKEERITVTLTKDKKQICAHSALEICGFFVIFSITFKNASGLFFVKPLSRCAT